MDRWALTRWFRRPRRNAAPGADVLITGLPRSGTSFFCAALHNLRDCVAINEPEEIFAPLSGQAPPSGMPDFYRQLRADVLAGRPIVNKMRAGRLIEDTAQGIREERYVPAVSGPGFLLATKNTLAYLARLPLLERCLPAATCVACIRHPVDTVASWKGTFGHLAAAAMTQFRVGFLGDRGLGPEAAARVVEIEATPGVELRRALLWRHLALLLEESRSFVGPVVRYEALVTDPEGTLRGLLDRIPTAPQFDPVQPFAPSQVRRQRAATLSREDRAAIDRVCADVAARFGYDLGDSEPQATS